MDPSGMQVSGIWHPLASTPVSHTTSEGSGQTVGSGVWQANGHTDPSGMQESPFQHDPVMPLSHLTSVDAHTDGAGELQTGGHMEPSGMQ